MNYRIGDIVRITAPVYDNTNIHTGMNAKIISNYKNNRYGLEFENHINGHTAQLAGSENGKDGFCWFLNDTHFELVRPESLKSLFKD